MAMTKLMKEEELKRWEQERVGGRTRYVLRNSIIWSLAFSALIFISKVITPYFFSRPKRVWFDLVGETIFITCFWFAATIIVLIMKWERNEQSYQSVKKDMTSDE